jgi:hypothetical protein
MMRNIAIGLAAATIAMAGSTLSASAHYGQESGISKGSMTRLAPREREHLRGIVHERLAELTPREREHLRGIVRERLAELTPREREHLSVCPKSC